jgi:hypothetical protein
MSVPESATALAEFKVAFDHWLPLLNERDQDKASTHVLDGRHWADLDLAAAPRTGRPQTSSRTAIIRWCAPDLCHLLFGVARQVDMIRLNANHEAAK